MRIRLETQNDYSDVENMVRNSFWNIYRPGAFEHFIVHNLRDDESFVKDLAYVIEKDDEIIGHINYSNGKLICDNGNVRDALVLGPIAIDRDYQNQGYGSKLIEYTLDLVKQKGIGFVFVVGDENYYRRFSFESASKYNIYLEGTDESEECEFFMIKIFNQNELNFTNATFHNPDVFDVDENEVDEFDRKFEYKEKKIQEGQLGV